jgi:hypothetical protein
VTVFWITFFVAGAIRLLWWFVKRSSAAPRKVTTTVAVAPYIPAPVSHRVLLECANCGAPNLQHSAVCPYCKNNLSVT